jgi:hypothetical protein
MPNLEMIDLVWLAIDAQGTLAAMITGGAGPIPPQALIHGEDDLFGIETELQQLPLLGRAILHVEVPNPASFQALGERGLFVYDWQDVHRASGLVGAYELVASPGAGLAIHELPNSLARLAVPIDDDQVLGAAVVKIR